MSLMSTSTFKEDLLSNAILALVMLIFICARDFCKRVSRSDCVYDTDSGLRIRLPTWRRSDSDSSGGGTDEVQPV